MIAIMPTPVDHLEPKAVWKHFAALAAIPRASEKEAAARDYVLGVAGRLGLESVQDAAGNTVIRKPARPGRESAVPAALQGHLDMVCEKNEGTAHDFDTDPIRLLADGDWLKGDGTTLGADQEILGDLHNLFGDTNAVHVRLGPTGETILDSVIKGDTVREVLNYVQFSAETLVATSRRDVETALREGRMTYEESGQLLRFYEEGLHGHTYLEDVHER